jgi:hypothetical protein
MKKNPRLTYLVRAEKKAMNARMHEEKQIILIS